MKTTQYRKTIILIALAFCMLLVTNGQAAGKKFLYVNSYHQGYAWSDQIEQAVRGVIEPTGAELKVLYLDTYKSKTPEHLAKVSEEAKKLIDEWKPDAVILSDDPAVKGILVPFYKDSAVPFVFCGVNWGASTYGLPCKNVTGMIEVCPIQELLAVMQKLKPGTKVGFLGSEGLTPQKDAENSAKVLGIQLDTVLAKDFAGWKQAYTDLQGRCDMLLLAVNAGIADWNETEARAFVEKNTKIVSGTWHDYLNGLAMVGFNKLASEQGEWAAKTAIQIADGTAPSSIAVVKNTKGELVINAKVAGGAGITIPFEMLQSAKVIE